MKKLLEKLRKSYPKNRLDEMIATEKLEFVLEKRCKTIFKDLRKTFSTIFHSCILDPSKN